MKLSRIVRALLEANPNTFEPCPLAHDAMDYRDEICAIYDNAAQLRRQKELLADLVLHTRERTEIQYRALIFNDAKTVRRLQKL